MEVLKQMEQQETFEEQVIKVPRPDHHFVLLRASSGAMLGLDDKGELALFDDGDDRVIWDQVADGVKHVVTGRVVNVDVVDSSCRLSINSAEMTFDICHGPDRLPSEYLEILKRDGFVCLPCILPPEVVEGLQRVSCTDDYEDLEINNDIPKICQDVAVGRALVEPVSLWVLRQYLQTRELHVGHPPGFGVVQSDQLARAGRGWHSDVPYTRSASGQLFDRDGPPKACNRNVVVTDFTRENGATVFRAGSHLIDSPPPEDWNAPLQEDPPGLPYHGPEATIYEAPAGSVSLYDSRTWHRAGFNRSGRKRAAMLTSIQVPEVIPKRDSRPACEKLNKSPVFAQLDEREQREVSELLSNQPVVA